MNNEETQMTMKRIKINKNESSGDENKYKKIKIRIKRS